ncbi:MAG: tetratricopeptide repeat protein, partial [Cyanobacteria bacterium REEB65]|nr:tetratricopeptide repeat protein [Cyanobacteria bacterium REEB65]
EVVYQNLLLASRRALHDQIGQVLEAISDDPAPLARTLALHFVRAEVPDKACRYLVLAADRSLSTYAVGEALDLYKQALDWHEKAGGHAVGIERSAILAGLASAEIMIGNPALALEHLEQALQDRPPEALASECRRQILKALIRMGDDRAAISRCTAILADLAKAGSGSLAERASLLTTEAEIFVRLGNLDEAIGTCQEALGLLAGTDHEAEMAGAHNILGNAAYVRRNFADASDHYQQAVALREKLQDSPGIAASLNNLALACIGRGQWAIAADCYDRALQIYSRIGDIAMVANIQTNLGALMLSMGRIDQAEAAFRRVEDVYTRLGHLVGQASA